MEEPLGTWRLARSDLIKITSVLSKKTDEEKLKLFRTEKFRPIAHFAGYDMPAAPIKTGVTGISTF